jgi:chromosome segregation ATPase
VSENEVAEKKDPRTRAREAAWAILREGERPTQRSVIDRMGGGSPNTVNEVLKEFWGEVGERLERPPLPEPIVAAVDELWRQAVAEARRTQQAYREVADQEIEAAKAAADTALKGEKAAQERAQQAQETIGQLRDRISELEKQLASEQARREDGERRARNAELRIVELEQQIKDKDRLREEALEKERALAREASEAAQRQIEEKTGEIAKLTLRHQTLEAESRVRGEAQQRRIQDLEDRIRQFSRQLERRDSEHESALGEIRVLRDDLSRAEDRIKKAEIEAAGLAARLEMTEKDRATLAERCEALLGQVDKLQTERAALVAKMARQKRRSSR